MKQVLMFCDRAEVVYYLGVPAQNLPKIDFQKLDFQNLAIYIFSKSHDFNFANPPP